METVERIWRSRFCFEVPLGEDPFQGNSSKNEVSGVHKDGLELSDVFETDAAIIKKISSIKRKKIRVILEILLK